MGRERWGGGGYMYINISNPGRGSCEMPALRLLAGAGSGGERTPKQRRRGLPVRQRTIFAE